MAGSIVFLATFRALASYRIEDASSSRELLLNALGGLAVAMVVYPAAVFFSTFIGRAMTAAAAGLAAALCLMAGIVIVWSQMDLQPRLAPALLAAEGLLGSTLFLWRRFMSSHAGRCCAARRAAPHSGRPA